MSTRLIVLPLDEVGVFFMQNKHNVTMLTQWLCYPCPIAEYLRSRERGT